MFEQTIVTITTLPNETIYVLLLVNAFIEYFFPPFPGDTIMVFGAYLCGTGKLDLSAVYLVSLVGSVSGFLALFSLGKHYGREFFLKRNFRFLSRGLILKVELWFQRYGIGLIIANRFFSGIRAVISVVSGIYRLPWPRVLALSGIGCAIWNGLLIFGGYELGSNWKAVEGVLRQYNRGLLFAALGLLAFWLVGC